MRVVPKSIKESPSPDSSCNKSKHPVAEGLREILADSEGDSEAEGDTD